MLDSKLEDGAEKIIYHPEEIAYRDRKRTKTAILNVPEDIYTAEYTRLKITWATNNRYQETTLLIRGRTIFVPHNHQIPKPLLEAIVERFKRRNVVV